MWTNKFHARERVEFTERAARRRKFVYQDGPEGPTPRNMSLFDEPLMHGGVLAESCSPGE